MPARRSAGRRSTLPSPRRKSSRVRRGEADGARRFGLIVQRDGVGQTHGRHRSALSGRWLPSGLRSRSSLSGSGASGAGWLGDRMRIFLLTNLRRSVALVKITSTKMSKTSEMTEATKPAAKNAAQPTMAEIVSAVGQKGPGRNEINSPMLRHVKPPQHVAPTGHHRID